MWCCDTQIPRVHTPYLDVIPCMWVLTTMFHVTSPSFFLIFWNTPQLQIRLKLATETLGCTNRTWGFHPMWRSQVGGSSQKMSPVSNWVIYSLSYKWIWVWVNTYRYIFSGMNIHLPAILGFTRYQGFDPSPYKWDSPHFGEINQELRGYFSRSYSVGWSSQDSLLAPGVTFFSIKIEASMLDHTSHRLKK